MGVGSVGGRRRLGRQLPLGAGLAVAGLALAVSATTVVTVASRGQLSATGLPATRPQSLTVSTDAGAVFGRTTGTVDQFLGMPYAAPPVGALRWEPPQPATPWQGVRSALSYGNRCPQLADSNGPRADTEDCLYLNVYAPTVIRAGKRLPVLFMIHGGRLVNGAGDQHDGSLIAQDEQVVVVSFNYRVGPLGFLSVPGLTASADGASGNFGLLDQEAALRWVNRNIAAFGGDPGKVTIAGESSGGWSVCALLASPPAKGLFSGAIMQSGSCASQPLAAAQASALTLAANAGCTVASAAAECLRGKTEAALLDASAGYQPEFISGGPELPVPPAQAIASGAYDKVPILMGTNHDEARIFTPSLGSWTQQQYVQFIEASYGPRAQDVLNLYPWTGSPAPYNAAYAVAAIWTDSGFITGIGGCPEQSLAQQFASGGDPVYFYQFDDRNAPPLSNTGPPGYQWGAGHAMELAYMWPSFTNGFSLYAELNDAQRRLSRQMIAYWGAFVRNGSPAVAGQPAWPAYRSQRIMSLRPGGNSRAIPAAAFAAQHHCAFWNADGQTAEAMVRTSVPPRFVKWSPNRRAWVTIRQAG
ncbi:MAG: carboxylesterase/lipase family protein [Micromonosporaceae bacterium]